MPESGLSFTDVSRFRAFIGRHYVELYRVVLREAFEALSLNGGEMHEDIR